MPARFMVMWFAISCAVYALMYLASRRERKTVWAQWKRVAISAAIGVCVVVPFFFLNNISGV